MYFPFEAEHTSVSFYLHIDKLSVFVNFHVLNGTFLMRDERCTDLFVYNKSSDVPLITISIYQNNISRSSPRAKAYIVTSSKSY